MNGGRLGKSAKGDPEGLFSPLGFGQGAGVSTQNLTATAPFFVSQVLCSKAKATGTHEG